MWLKNYTVELIIVILLPTSVKIEPLLPEKKYKIKENSITLSLSIHVQETLKERV
jgi:hypothetical protein